MTDELYEAALALLPYLNASTDGLELTALERLKRVAPLEGETTAQRLRREADELEAKDAAIRRFRNAVAAFHRNQTPFN